MGRGPDLTCREVVELVTDYLEDVLSPSDRARFDEHLAICEGCTNYIDQMRTILRVTGSLTEETIPTGARDRLVETFRGWRRGPGR